MRKKVVALAMLAVAAGAVACGDLLGTSNTGDRFAAELGTKGDSGTKPDSGTRPDTASKPDTSTRPDTSTKPDTGTRPDTTFPGDTTTDARITGTMIGIDSTVTPFVELGPIANVKITLFSVRYVNDSSGTDTLTVRLDSVGVTTSNAVGKFEFRRLQRGVYLMRAVPPAGSGYRPGEIGASAYSPRDFVQITPIKFYLHRD
jgi:hypothetical protein